MELVIYGAQGIALGMYKAIKTLFIDKEVFCFLVSEMNNNPPALGGIPVIELKSYIHGMTQVEKDNVVVLICTPENAMDAIEKSLEEAKLFNYIRVTSMCWAEMMQRTFKKTGEFCPLSVYPVGTHNANIYIYKMIHQNDKGIQTQIIEPEYYYSLQVGANISLRKKADFYDDEGDSISVKNKNFSELTGLYWIWKNRIIEDSNPQNYYGLAHYRRLLYLSDDDILRLCDNDIDAILPYPMPYEPNIEVHHERYLSAEEWNSVLIALEELQPCYANALKDILKQNYFYNYNIIIAKRDVLADYCEWLFPILFRIEELNDPKSEKLPNRYIGYVGETLETLYFMYNRNELTIAHAGCKFLI